MRLIRQHPLVSFFVLAYLLSWHAWLLWLVHLAPQPGLDPLGPFAAALIVSGIAGGWSAVKRLLRRILEWRVGLRWYALITLLPVAICMIAVSVNLALGAPAPAAAKLAAWTEVPARFLFILLFIGLGEEPGWRGFALPRLLERHSELKASLVLGTFWALWHLPLTFTELKMEYVPQFLLSIFPATYVITWLFHRSKGSVLLPMLFHGVVNAVGGGYFFQMFSGRDLVRLWWLYAGLWFLAGAGLAVRSHLQGSPAATVTPRWREA